MPEENKPLNQGRAYIAALQNEYDSLPYSESPEDIERADELFEELLCIDMAIGGIRRAMGTRREPVSKAGDSKAPPKLALTPEQLTRRVQEHDKISTEFQFAPDGSLALSYYDFSSSAGHFVGGDIAYNMTIPQESRAAVLELLGVAAAESKLSNQEFLDAIIDGFVGFIALKRKLETTEIEHQCIRDPWA